MLVLFLWLAITFHLRCRRAAITHSGVTSVLHTLYVSTAIITGRTIFRTVEYWSIADFHVKEGVGIGDLSPIVRYEWYFYVFEAVLMLANNVMLNIRHPRKYLPKSAKTYLAQDGVTEVTGPGYEDKRPWIVTVLDPFDLGGLFKGDKDNKFWEKGADEETSTGSAKANGKGEAGAAV